MNLASSSQLFVLLTSSRIFSSISFWETLSAASLWSRFLISTYTALFPISSSLISVFAILNNADLPSCLPPQITFAPLGLSISLSSFALPINISLGMAFDASSIYGWKEANGAVICISIRLIELLLSSFLSAR